jgi:hypothetical protein
MTPERLEEIRMELEPAGYTIATSDDAKALYHAYEFMRCAGNMTSAPYELGRKAANGSQERV